MMQSQSYSQSHLSSHEILTDQWLESNETLLHKTAEERVMWALDYQTKHDLGAPILSSSFGIQSAVALHLLTKIAPNIPVILVDTGYLFPETYRFIDQLTDQLQLNLHVYRADLSGAWQEARYGKRYEQGLESLEAYNLENKVAPMQKALAAHNAGLWFTGIRRAQSSTRQNLQVLSLAKRFDTEHKILKCAPIMDWSNQQVYEYLKKNGLNYHPLWDEGYVSMGDIHSTKKLLDGMTEEETRFNGLKRECGLHEM